MFKLNPAGEVSWQYEGRLLKRAPRSVVLEAFFDIRDTPVVDAVLKRGDRFIETFYEARWYNLFEIYDRDDGKLKGWYCNICRPALFTIDTVSWVDLALDLWVSPEGRQTVLDEHEFRLLVMSRQEQRRALTALKQLQRGFVLRQPPL